MRPSGDRSASSDTQTAATLHEALSALKNCGAERFDAVRFHYIESLATRAQQQDSAVASLLVAKAWRALQSYQSSFYTRREEVAALLDQITEHHPDMTEQLQSLFNACEFKAINTLVQRQEKAHEIDTFASLTRRLKTTADDSNSLPASSSQELKAVRHFREAQQRHHADKLVTNAILDAPESAGPLNPQKLALRSLAIMREVSPAYLTHFVCYVDTLFWLERLDTLPPAKSH